jgi:hydroxymethylpyrimidine pyrophosphatase-like HAD family hydrolase
LRSGATGEHMPYHFRVVAVDYDGTIAEDDEPCPQALEAIAELRRGGHKVLLVTGRILEELRAVFPDVDQHFDAVIAENGGITVIGRRIEYAGEPFPGDLTAAMGEAGVPFRTGRVLIATEARHDEAVLKEVERLGLEAQLVYNRGALMILPANVSKGSGLLHALGAMELSRHGVIAIGDAENDHSLLHVCEIGVAVANAVPALRARADICLNAPNGRGVAAFLRGPVLRGDIRIFPQRWHVELGVRGDGTPARLPGSRINLLIAGASGSGKSRMAGLLIERLVAHGYSVCVLDAEGDHGDLEELTGVVRVGGTDPLPSPARLASVVRHRFSSVIVDLSLLDVPAKRAYSVEALAALEDLRQDRGSPHWIIIEEADQLLPGSVPGSDANGPQGLCMVTHRPFALHAKLLAAVDAVLALPGAEEYAQVPFPSNARGDSKADRAFNLRTGEALLALGTSVHKFQVAERAVRHVRHQHKYAFAQVAPERRFLFGIHGTARPAAGNISEFRREIARADDAVVSRHLRAGDFSRWLRDVVADDELGARVRNIERWWQNEPGVVSHARTAIVAAIDDRYVTDCAVDDAGEIEAASRAMRLSHESDHA